MRTNSNDQKTIKAKKNNSSNTDKSLTNKDDAGKNESPKKDAKKNYAGSTNEQIKRDPSIFKL